MDLIERIKWPIEFKHKEVCYPESLLHICLKYLVRDLSTFCSETPNGYTLFKGLTLPRRICEEFIECFQNNNYELTDSIANLFNDITRTTLRSVHIRNSTKITDNGLKYLLQHNLDSLSITNCPKITYKGYTNIFEQDSKLCSISICPNKKITPYYDSSSCLQTSDKINNKKATNLKQLVLQSVAESPNSSDNQYLIDTLNSLSQLRLLDLTYCSGVGTLKYLSQLTSLHTLVLFDVDNLQDNNAILNICVLQSLVVLDISQKHNKHYKNENAILAQIVKSLPHLMALDISGTNLAGEGRAEHSTYQSLSGKRSDIPGLEYRVDNPLEFLGLYLTKHNACLRPHIPAKKISGHANIKQLFNAVASSMGKTRFMQEIILEFHRIFMLDQCTQIDDALDVVLEILNRYRNNKLIQLCGCATIYLIVQNKELVLLNEKKRRIVTALLTAMNQINGCTPLLRHVYLSLCELSIPQDLMFEYSRLVKILLNFLSRSFHIAYDVGFHILGSLVSQATSEQKNEIGEANAIEIMLEVIQNRLYKRQCDCVLEGAWSTMQNLTDGSPKNCERFLNRNGVKYFLRCLKAFPREYELKCHMLRLLGNITEIRDLRPRLMKPYYVQKFSSLLFPMLDGIEVSYNAVRIIAYLASDGHEAWTISKHPWRNHMLNRITKAIQLWNLDADRNINYQSFKPILQLAQIRHTPQCALFAVWALASLTKKHPEKYCSIVIAEDGLRIIRELEEHEFFHFPKYLSKFMKSLAQTVINQCLKSLQKSVGESSQ